MAKSRETIVLSTQYRGLEDPRKDDDYKYTEKDRAYLLFWEAVVTAVCPDWRYRKMSEEEWEVAEKLCQLFPNNMILRVNSDSMYITVYDELVAASGIKDLTMKVDVGPAEIYAMMEAQWLEKQSAELRAAQNGDPITDEMRTLPADATNSAENTVANRPDEVDWIIASLEGQARQLREGMPG